MAELVSDQPGGQACVVKAPSARAACGRRKPGREPSSKLFPARWRSAVARSPQQLALDQLMAARMLAQHRRLAVREGVIQIRQRRRRP
jgi:hypothetical protein